MTTESSHEMAAKPLPQARPGHRLVGAQRCECGWAAATSDGDTQDYITHLRSLRTESVINEIAAERATIEEYGLYPQRATALIQAAVPGPHGHRQLVIAAALLIAEIERLDRAEGRQ